MLHALLSLPLPHQTQNPKPEPCPNPKPQNLKTPNQILACDFEFGYCSAWNSWLLGSWEGSSLKPYAFIPLPVILSLRPKILDPRVYTPDHRRNP